MSVYLLFASILWPARREYEGAQGAPHRAIPELGRDRGGYRLLDLAERPRAALNDRAQDRVALDQPDCRIGGGRARAGLRAVRPGDLSEAGPLPARPHRR